MNKFLLIAFIPFAFVLGCSDGNKKSISNQDHLLSDQQRAMEKARNVENVIQKSFDSRRKGEK